MTMWNHLPVEALGVVYDGTVTAAHERTMGPGRPRVAHAFPEGSNVALCGALKGGERPPVSGKRCPDCEYEAGRRSGLAR